MSEKSKYWFSVLFIVVLVVWWLYHTIGMLFFIDELHSNHWRSWFNESDDSYPVGRVIKPLFLGVGILYIWLKADIKNTGIAWLGFAILVAITFFYTLAVPPTTYPSGSPPKNNKPTIVCNDNGCHAEPPKPN